MSKKSFLNLLFIFIIIISVPVYSWDKHCLATKPVVDILSGNIALLNVQAPVEPLKTFLDKNSSEIKNAFIKFYKYKKRNYKFDEWRLTPENKKVMESDSILTPYQFKQLLGIRNMAFDKIVVYDEFKEIYGIDEINNDTILPFGEWLALFCDEPDEGFDQFLFGNGDPRYGDTPPWGEPDKLSSQGCFHMNFGNESFILYKIRPSLKKSMAFLRFRIFFQIARIAIKNNDNFWGARLLGESLHYFQDMTVPYHSKTFPNLHLSTYWNLFTAKDKAKFISDMTQLLSNKHFIFEDLAKNYMLKNHESPSALLPNIRELVEGATLRNTKEQNANEKLIDKLIISFKKYSKRAYKDADKDDKVICSIFPDKYINDPSYDPYSDPNFTILEYYNPTVMADYAKSEREYLKVFLPRYKDLLTVTSIVIKSALK